MYPVFWLPPVTPLTCQVTAVLGTPFTVAENGGGGGALLPPQELRNREAARMGISKTAVRMRSPGRGGTTHVSTANVLLSKDFTRVSSSANARNASKAAGLVPE